MSRRARSMSAAVYLVLIAAIAATLAQFTGQVTPLAGERQLPPVVPKGTPPLAVSAPLVLGSVPQSDGVRETALTSRSAPDDVEPWVAANPANPLNFIVAGISWSQGQSILVAATLDGGRTWHRSTLPRAPDAVFHADPAVVFDAQGVAYLANIPATTSGNSGVPIGIEVTRSLDGGLTWSPAIRISANYGKDDKTAIAVDTSPDSPYFGRVYVAWKWPGGGIYISHSDDQGSTYTSPARVSDDFVSGLSLASLDDGTLLLAANRGGGSQRGIVVYRSADGGASFSAGARVATTRARWYVGIPANCGVGALVQTSMTVQRGENADSVALLWDDHQPGSPQECSDSCQTGTACRSQAYMARSMNDGQSWLSPVPVSPAGFSAGDQYFSWLTSGGPDDALYISQRSSHEDPGRQNAHTWLLRSEDGGASWAAVARLSGSSGFQTGSFWQGDYAGLAVSQSVAVAAWTDLRFQSTELYAAAVDLTDTIEIEPALTGAWFDPSQDGHGFQIQVLDSGRVLIYWFTFDSEGRPAWMFGVGEIEGEVITAELYYEPDGPRFPPDFDPADFQPLPWGTLDLYFFDCNNGHADWSTTFEGFESGSMELTRLTNTATLNCEE